MEPREVRAHLKRIPAFRSLPEEGESELLRLVPHVRERTYPAGAQMFTESEAPDKTVIILEGRVRIKQTVEGATTQIRELGQRVAGAILGRATLELGDFERTAVEAIEETRVLELPFRDLIKGYEKSSYLREYLEGPLKPERLINTLKGISLFSKLTDRVGELELYQIASITHEQYFEHEEWLFRQGETSDRLFYVLSGNVRLTQVDPLGISHRVDTLGPGDTAGETGLLVGDFHDVTAAAEDYARVLYILRAELHDLLEERPYLERKLAISERVAQRRRLRQFDWLRDDEWVVAVVQRHWTRLFRQTAPLVLILLLLLPVLVALLRSESTFLLIIAALLAIPMLLLLGGIFWQYMNWRDDYFVVTTQRVAHIERVWPLSTQLEETSLDNVEDIYEAQSSLTANLMNYGDLVLQTAGETVDIDMSYVPNPGHLRELISEQMGRARARDILRTRGEIRDLLARRLKLDGRDEEETEREEGASKQTEPIRPQRERFLPALFFTSILQFLFPASRVTSEGGSTIIWRRYWVPGLIRHVPMAIVFLLVTFGGPLVFLPTLTMQGGGAAPVIRTSWLLIWLFAEAVLFSVLLWLIEDWRNDYFELTLTHIILVERRPLLLQESRHEARLDRIQNLGYEIPSLLGRIFGYGHVQFETAGTEGKFQLQYVRNPEEVQQTISNRQYEYRQRQRQLEANRRQQELLHWFSTYDELHRDTSV
ncbi:MAG: cyclic nucleotide-binding domain-containing protein [Anaerolineae bacterium]